MLTPPPLPVSLFAGPVAFSAEITHRTKNPKVTRLPFLKHKTLTLQVKPFYLWFLLLPLYSSTAFPACFTDSKRAVVGQAGKMCAVCGLHMELKCSVLLTLTLSSENGNVCPLLRPRHGIIAEALTQTALWFSLPDHKLCICSWPRLLAVWRHYQRWETPFFVVVVVFVVWMYECVIHCLNIICWRKLPFPCRAVKEDVKRSK